MKIAQKPEHIMDDTCTSVLGPQIACLQPVLLCECECECMSDPIIEHCNMAGNCLNSFGSFRFKMF